MKIASSCFSIPKRYGCTLPKHTKSRFSFVRSSQVSLFFEKIGKSIGKSTLRVTPTSSMSRSKFGIVCDARCKAAEGIYAVGDVARWFHEGFGVGIRLENRSNTVEQAMAVASNIVGKDKPYTPVPFFWTDQYETKIQLHGFSPAEADVAILEGDPGQGSFVAAYGSRGKVCGVLGWNMMKQARAHRKHVVEGTAWAEINRALETPPP